MRYFIDTNILIDICTEKEGFYNSSYSALIRLLDNNNECYISSTCLTDILHSKKTNK